MATEELKIPIQVNVTQALVDKIDARAEQLALELGTPISRAAILRIAVAKYLGLTFAPKEDDQQPAAPPATGA